MRIRAAASLSGVPRSAVPEAHRAAVDKATAEYLEALSARPDLWTSQYNLGNYYLGQGDPEQAAACYETARRLDGAVPPRVNASIAYSQMVEAACNLSLLLLEAQPDEAVAWMRAASRLRPDNPRYAYTLALALYRAKEPDEALQVLRPVIGEPAGYPWRPGGLPCWASRDTTDSSSRTLPGNEWRERRLARISRLPRDGSLEASSREK